MICKSCNKELADDVNFCPYCGTAVSEPQDEPEVKICPECKKEYEINSVFCEDCGTKLIIKPSHEPEPKPKHDPFIELPLYSIPAGYVLNKTAHGEIPGRLYIYSDRVKWTSKECIGYNMKNTYSIGSIAKAQPGLLRHGLLLTMKDGMTAMLSFSEEHEADVISIINRNIVKYYKKNYN